MTTHSIDLPQRARSRMAAGLAAIAATVAAMFGMLIVAGGAVLAVALWAASLLRGSV